MSEGIRRLPTWAKFIIALLIVAFLGLNVLIGVYIWASKTVWKNDPTSVKASIEKMVSFQTPLNSDYFYKTAFDADFVPVKFAVIIYKPDNLEIVLLQISGSDINLTPQRIITEHRRTERRRADEKPVFVENGTKEVAGTEMSYAIAKSMQGSTTATDTTTAPMSNAPNAPDAKTSAQPNPDAPMFAGTALVSKPKPHCFVCAVSPLSGSELDKELIETFLKNISKIY